MPQDPIPPYSEWLKTRKPPTSDIPTFDQFKASRSTRPRSQAQAEIDATNTRTQFEQAQSAFQSASGQKLNPPVDSTAPSYYRPLTASEQEARKRGEPVIISEAAQQSPVAPELTSRPRTVTNATVSPDPVIQGRLEQIEREKRQRDTQRKVEQARQVLQRRQPSGLLLPAGQRNAGSNFKPTFAGTGGRVIPPQSNIPTAADFAAWGASPSSEPQTFAEDRERRRKLSGVGELRKQDDPLAAREIRVQKHIQDQVVKDVAGSQENFARVKADYEKLGRGAEFQQKVEQATATKLNDFRQREAQVSLAEQGKLATLGLMDKISEIGDKPSQLVPFLASAVNIHELLALGSAAGRLEDGKATELDLLRLREFNAAAQRDSTFMYKVANVVSGLPSFVGEIALTGGLYTLGKEAALKGLQRLATKQGLAAIEKRLVGRLAVKSVASLAGSALQTLPASATRIPEGVLFRERGGADFSNALRDTLTDQFIEIASERAGGLLTEIPLPKKLSAIRDAITARWVSKIPGRTAEQLQKLVEKTGWHGPIGEIFEERFGDAAKYGVGLQSSPIPSLEQLAVEGLAFSVPGGVEAVANKMLRTKMPASQTLIDYAINSPLTTAEDKAKIEKLVASGVTSTEDVQAILSGETIPDQKPEARAANPSEVSPVIEKAQQSALDQSTEARGPSSTPPAVESKEVKPESRPKGTVSSSEASSPGILENITETITKPVVEKELKEGRTLAARNPLLDQPAPGYSLTFSELAQQAMPDIVKIAGRSPTWRDFQDGLSALAQDKERDGPRGGQTRVLGQLMGEFGAGETYAALRTLSTTEGRSQHRDTPQSQGQPAVEPPAEVKTQPSATESQLTTAKEVTNESAEPSVGGEAVELTTLAAPGRATAPDKSVAEKDDINEEPKTGNDKLEALSAQPVSRKETAQESLQLNKKLTDWGSRLKTIAQSKSIEDLQALSDEMAAHKDDPKVAKLRHLIQNSLANARQVEIPEPQASQLSPPKLSQAAQKTLKQAETPEGKTVRTAPTHRIGAPKADASRNSLEQQVRAHGGIKDDASQAYKGELKWLSESAKRGAVNHSSGISVEQMATKLAQDGYGKGVWWEGSANNVDHQAFLQAVMDDARGSTKHYSTERDAIEDDPDVKAWDTLVEDETGKELIERVQSGRARAADIVQFVREASAHGLSDQALDAFVSSLQRTVQEELSGGTEEAEGYTLNEDGTLLDPDGTPLFAREFQLGLPAEGLTQQAEQPKTDDQRERLRREQQERDEAADPERAAALRKLVEIRRRGMTVEEYSRQGSMFEAAPSAEEIGILRELEKAEKASKSDDSKDAQASMFARAPVTETEAFKKWFGESQIVDKQGEPLVVYHRSPFKFESFDPNKIEHFGFHFGTRKQAQQVNLSGERGRMYDAYLSIQNPLRLPDLGTWHHDAVVRELKKLSLITEDQADTVYEAWDPNKELREVLKAQGYDGIVYENDGERVLVDRRRDVYADSYIAFDPTQIKSASRNIGTFDPNSPSILAARGTTSETPSFGVEGNRVSLNQQGAKLLDEAFRELGRIGKDDPGNIRGAFEKHPAALISALDKMAKAGRAGAAELAAAVRRASQEGSGKVVLFYGENARKHELFHEASDKASRLMDERHADLPSLINTDTFRKMSDRLIAIGYPGANLPVLVEEAAAHLAEGKYELLGITREEAIDWMFKWFKSFEKKNPHVTPRQFQEMSDEATEARDKVYATESRVSQPQSDQTLSRLHAGRARGAGASLARTSDITQTESFRNWFKESRVVDEDGKPLRAFHGTAKDDFNEFSPNRKSQANLAWTGDMGHWFTAPSKYDANYDEENAEYMAGDFSRSRGQDLLDYPEGAQILPVYLSINNPAEFEGWDDFDDQRGRKTGAEFRAALERQGHDGVVIRNSDTDGFVDRDDWIAFESSQIKSATGNRGTFDPNDPNILMARSEGDPLTEQQFYNSYFQHVALRSRGAGTRPDFERILEEGWSSGIGPNARHASRGGEPTNVIDRNYGVSAGDVVFLIPKEWIRQTPNGPKIKDGWKPKRSEVVIADYDYQPAYELYRKGLESDPLFARSDDPWADLMELSDEFGRLANEPELAEGEKATETKQSRLAAGVEAKAIEAKLTTGFQGLPEYETVKVADQARMAAELLRNDPQEARRVALGQSVPPGNLLPESVFVALENQALQQRDVGLLRELATISTLSAEATGMGQRIRMLAERNPYSPVTAMREIQTAREARAKKKMGPKFRERVITEIKTEVRKSAPKAKDWKSFLEEIKCK